MSPESQESIVRRACHEFFNRGNLNAMDDLNAPDCVWHRPSGPDIKGQSAYKERMIQLFNAFSDIEFKINDFVAQGDMNVIRYSFQGTHTRQWPVVPIVPTGKRVTVTGVLMTRLVSGRAVEHWEYLDILGFMQQLGAVVPTASADPKAIAKQWIAAENEAWQKGNFELLEAIEDPNIAIHIPPAQETVGWQAHKEYLQNARQMMSDIKQQWDFIVGAGNVCALSYKSSSKIIGEHPNVPLPIGKTLNMDSLFVLRLANGKVAEIWAKGRFTIE